MARPRKSTNPQLSRDEFRASQAYGFTRDDLLPDDPTLLKDIVAALLNRIHRQNEAEARHLMAYLHSLAAQDYEWSQRPTPIGLRSGRECREYWDRRLGWLDAVVCGKVTKATHFGETVLRQQKVVDVYLGRHQDYLTCRNSGTLATWLKEHEADLIGLLVRYPCFHDYGDALDLHRPLNTKVDEKLKPGKFRDLILAIVHSTTPVQIAKIRKQGLHRISMDDRLFRPFEEATLLPFSGVPLLGQPF